MNIKELKNELIEIMNKAGFKVEELQNPLKIVVFDNKTKDTNVFYNYEEYLDQFGIYLI